jgi:hypothetical protein
MLARRENGGAFASFGFAQVITGGKKIWRLLLQKRLLGYLP